MSDENAYIEWVKADQKAFDMLPKRIRTALANADTNHNSKDILDFLETGTSVQKIIDFLKTGDSTHLLDDDF